MRGLVLVAAALGAVAGVPVRDSLYIAAFTHDVARLDALIGRLGRAVLEDASPVGTLGREPRTGESVTAHAGQTVLGAFLAAFHVRTAGQVSSMTDFFRPPRTSGLGGGSILVRQDVVDAVERRALPTVRALLAKAPGLVNASDANGLRPLHLAAYLLPVSTSTSPSTPKRSDFA
jgi:hypothetical protein